MNIQFYDDLVHDVVSINYVIPIGLKTLYNGKKNNFAHLIEHLLFYGHPEYNQYELMLKIEHTGGLINATTNDYCTEFYARVQSKHLIETVELMHKAILNFSIEQSDYEREKEIVFIEEKEYLEERNQIFQYVIDEMFGKIHKEEIPSYENVLKIYKEVYNNWSLIIIGKLNESDKAMINHRFKQPENENSKIQLDNILAQTCLQSRVCTHKKIGKHNKFIYIYQCSDESDVLSMKLIKYLYTKGLASILYDYFVAEQGYCYFVNFREYITYTNFFVIEFTYDDAPFIDMKNYIERVFAEQYIEDLEDEQFERAKNMIITETILKKERVSAILNDRVANCIFDKDTTITNEMIERLKKMKIEDIRFYVKKSLFYTENIR